MKFLDDKLNPKYLSVVGWDIDGHGLKSSYTSMSSHSNSVSAESYVVLVSNYLTYRIIACHGQNNAQPK